MPLQAQQIVALATQDARVPGMVAQAGQLLNMILSDLCQTYDFETTRKTYQFTFNPGQVAYAVTGDLPQGYQDFPTDYLRGIAKECFYVISGVPYPMIPVDQNEFDALVSQSGLSNYPVFFFVDTSVVPPRAFFWMIPSGAYPALVRYYSQMPDIATPETSTTIPWFPNQTYLRRRLAGELMALSDDTRMDQFLSDNEEQHPSGAGVMLRKYLKMKGDKENRSQTVSLDRRRFGSSFDRLRNTKALGW
jgi:hypothetical protein